MAVQSGWQLADNPKKFLIPRLPLAK